MNAAAEAGLAPRVLHSNKAEGIAIIDWIESVPFPTAQALVCLPATLRGLHLLPPFPKTFNYVTAHKFFIWRLRTANLLPEAEVEEVFCGYKRICAVYPRLDADLVSCHMDLKPENILFDGRRVWLIDWRAAFLNDRYFDLAIVANFVVANEADERTYLAEYFGQPPDEYQRARFFLMCRICFCQALRKLTNGLYGPLIVLPEGETFDPKSDLTFVFSIGDFRSLQELALISMLIEIGQVEAILRYP